MFVYWTAQFLGAFLGLITGYLIYDSVVGPFESAPGVFDLASNFIGEIIGTFFFIFFILVVTT